VKGKAQQLADCKVLASISRKCTDAEAGSALVI